MSTRNSVLGAHLECARRSFVRRHRVPVGATRRVAQACPERSRGGESATRPYILSAFPQGS